MSLPAVLSHPLPFYGRIQLVAYRACFLSSFFVQELHLPVMRMVCLSLARDAKAVMAMPDPTLHILGNHVNLRINSRSNHI